MSIERMIAVEEEKKLDSEWLLQELFLNASIPTIRAEIRKRMFKFCYGCRDGSLSQVAHECISSYERMITPLVPEAAIFLGDKRYKILMRMKEILESSGEEYGTLTALDILEFLGNEDEDPFKQIGYDRIWLRRLKVKVIQDSDNVYPSSDVVVQKRPKIEDVLKAVFK